MYVFNSKTLRNPNCLTFFFIWTTLTDFETCLQQYSFIDILFPLNLFTNVGFCTLQ